MGVHKQKVKQLQMRKKIISKKVSSRFDTFGEVSASQKSKINNNMTKKEPLLDPQLGMKVFHEKIHDGNECIEVVGIRKDFVELEGDFSGDTHNVIQKDWFPIKGLFRLRKVCNQIVEHGNCSLHNIHCGFPDCEPYLTSDRQFNWHGSADLANKIFGDRYGVDWSY